MAKINLEDIEAFARTFEDSQWQEMEFSGEGCELFLSKNAGAGPTWIATPTYQKQSRDVTDVQSVRGNPAGGAQDAGASAATSHISEPGQGLHVIKSPSVGTFYRSAKPGIPPFVEVGQQVELDTELCLIEVMKLFTTLKSDVSGIIREILNDDGGMVEYGQPLFLIEVDN